MENPTSNFFSNIPLNQLNNFVHLKVKEDNFITWRHLMNPVIHKYKLMKYLDGSYPCPPQYTNPRNQLNGIENSLYTDWIDEDYSIMMWLHSTISDSVISYFSMATTSHELWFSIEERFARASSTHSIQLLVAGEVIYDKELVVITLKALNADYIPFDTSMRHRNPPIASIELHNNILSEEPVISERAATLKLETDAKIFMANTDTTSTSYRGSYSNSRGSFRGRGYGGGGRFPNPAIFHRSNTGRGYNSAVKQPC
ncbi:uncharacterized protein LOC113331015 [Papaver somniferum]|uniref:uncharacterized protein LOC113331015 n=1 Tax=Papaver somniferum TaxID=3469 RepID=UPI000E70033D|nr:uncharacterized protein LOC113331015 [Papaver somniferum]